VSVFIPYGTTSIICSFQCSRSVHELSNSGEILTLLRMFELIFFLTLASRSCQRVTTPGNQQSAISRWLSRWWSQVVLCLLVLLRSRPIIKRNSTGRRHTETEFTYRNQTQRLLRFVVRKHVQLARMRQQKTPWNERIATVSYGRPCSGQHIYRHEAPQQNDHSLLYKIRNTKDLQMYSF